MSAREHFTAQQFDDFTGPDDDDIAVAVIPITDENRDDLKWLAIAQMLAGRSCVFCGYTWESRASVNARAPIAASDGAEDLACTPCWNEGKRL